MIYGSVCSGIEAATVAWHSLGWRPAWFSEIDTFPSKVLAHHYPHVRNHGDFTRIGADAGPINLLVGGTPCQPFSIAGLREGLDDERGNLALEYCRLADRLRPRWVVWENVPGVLSSWTGPKPPSDLEPGQEWEATETSDFGSFCAGLVSLGYGLAYRVLDAQYVGGCEVHGEPFVRGPVPQRRRRVFVVGYLGDWRRAAAVLFEPESLRGDPPARGKAGQAAARGARRRAASGGGTAGTLNANGKAAGSATQQDAESGLLVPTAAGTLGGGSGSRGWAPDTDRMTFIPQTVHTLRADGFDASEDGTGRGNQRSAAPQVYGRNNTSGPDRTAGALTAHGGPHGRQDFGSETFVPQSAVRRLTPRECERLQGFPDDYTAIPGAADGPRYKALGNSMAVPVMRWIGERIQRVENICARFR